jgi:class 3 adenylate cyclase
MEGSTALKEELGEHAFQKLRKEHDALLTNIITQDGAGRIVKSTGDGLLAVFSRPSTAVERAIEMQGRLWDHPNITVRIGIDIGEVTVESTWGVLRG